MQKLLSALVAGVTFPPELVTNDKRKGPFDVFAGQGSGHYNELFKDCRLNATWVDSGTFGDCYSNGSCSGIFETLRSHQADVAFHPVAIDFPPGFNITFNYPVHVGPMMDEMAIEFLAQAYQSGYRLNSDILATIRDCSPEVYVIQVLLVVVIYMLLNVSIRMKKNGLKVVHGKKVSWINLHAMCFRQLIVRVKRPHRSLIIASIVIFAMLMLAVFAGLFKSNMVYEYPPKYYSSIEQIVERVHSKSVIVIQGLVVHSKLMRLNGSIFRRLIPISEAFPRGAFPAITQKMADDRILVAPTSIVVIVHGLVCSMNKQIYLSLRRSDPVYKSYTYVAFSSRASLEVKERFARYYTHYFASGVPEYYALRKIAVLASTFLTNDASTLHRCLLTESMMKWPSVTFNAFSYAHFKPLFVIMFYSYSLSIVILVVRLVANYFFKSARKRKKPIARVNRVRPFVPDTSSWHRVRT